ncbi:hypothetical protein LCGC14_2092120, partial [marine sediment metagenome]
VVESSEAVRQGGMYRCSGAADDVEIQEAIDLAEARGGGTVEITEGGFYTTAVVTLPSNVVLRGRGAASIIEKNGNFRAIECIGSDGSEKVNVQIRDLKLTRNASDTNAIELLYGTYADGLALTDMWMEEGYEISLHLDHCDDFMLDRVNIKHSRNHYMKIFYCDRGTIKNPILDGDNIFTGIPLRGIWVQYSGQTNIINPILKNGRFQYGIYFGQDAEESRIDGPFFDNVWYPTGILCIITSGGNRIIMRDITIENCNRIVGADLTSSAIYINADDCEISRSRITDFCGRYAIRITNTSNRTIVNNNFCKDNGQLIDRARCESTTSPMIFGETVPWLNNVDTYARSNEQAYEGTYSWKGVGDGVGVMWLGFIALGASLHGLIPGLTYTMTARVYVPSGGYTASNVRLRYDDDQTSPVYSDGATGLDAWKLLSLTFTVDSAATNIVFMLEVNETGTDAVYLDNLRLKPLGVHNEHSQNFLDAGTDTQVG